MVDPPADKAHFLQEAAVTRQGPRRPTAPLGNRRLRRSGQTHTEPPRSLMARPNLGPLPAIPVAILVPLGIPVRPLAIPAPPPLGIPARLLRVIPGPRLRAIRELLRVIPEPVAIPVQAFQVAPP
jgi:hypothetical protein